MIGKICGTGSYIPDHVLDNNDLAQMVETNDEWIRERTGVIRRHIVKEDTAVTMAAIASQRALEDAGVCPEEVDLILAATSSSEMLFPGTACEVQSAIGAVNATGFDLSAACTGYVFAYNTAQAYIQSGMYKTILIIGVDCMSNITNWTDRGTCILFGDGAGATVMKAAESEGLHYSATHSDGSKGNALTCASRNQKKFEENPCAPETYIQMDGQAVFKFAVKRVPEVVTETLEKAELTIADVDFFLLHQANSRIVESVAKRLHAPIEKFPMNLQEYGNTSAATIPVLIDELQRKDILKKGQKIIISGFGAGLSWGATLLEWDK